MRMLHTLVLLLMMFGAARVAAADDDVGVVVTGDAAFQPQLATQIEEWLRDHGHAVTAAPLPGDAIESLIDCLVLESGGGACARGIVDHRASAKTVVFTKIDVTPTDGGMRDVKLSAYWFQKGMDMTARQRTCERCTAQMLHNETDALMSDLAKSRQKGSGRLHLTSAPAGAKVVIDNEPVGVTPLDYDLVPGNHQVTLLLDRHEVETRSVAIRVGDTEMLNVPLLPAREDRRGWHVRPLPLTLALGGAIALGAGAYWIAIDEDPSPTGPLYIRDSATKGVAFAAAGTVALGTGLWLLFRKSDSAPVASASRDGGSVGWFARF